MLTAVQTARVQRALPFWMSLLLVPLAIYSAQAGGWTLALIPVVTWFMFSVLDLIVGLELENADPQIGDEHLTWYKAITVIWAPVQFVLLFWMIWYANGPGDAHLSPVETIVLFFGMGVISGTIGINYSHELMHQKSKVERWMGDILLAMVLYSHFRSEHLLVHHRYVGTPRDPVTARFNEGFHRFFPRVLKGCWRSAFNAEKDMLARRKLPWTDLSNPFFRYWALQGAMLLLALLLGACKIMIHVPPNGTVPGVSGTHPCGAGSSCEVVLA